MHAHSTDETYTHGDDGLLTAPSHAHTHTTTTAEFRHEYFQRGRPDLLHLIKRKVSQATGSGAGSGPPARAPPPPPNHKPPASPPSSLPALTAAAAMMAMPGSASALSLDEAAGEGGAGFPSASSGGGGGKTSKAWQKRTEHRLAECEEQVRRLYTENQILWMKLHSTQGAAKALKRTQLRLVGIVQNLLLPGAAAASADGGGGGGGAALALQKLRAELEALSTSPAAGAHDGALVEGLDGTEADALSVLPPSMAAAAATAGGGGAGGGGGEEGVHLLRMLSASDPVNFFRNFSRAGSLGSIPSFGPGAVHSLQDPGTAAVVGHVGLAPAAEGGAGTTAATTVASAPAAAAGGMALPSPPTGVPPDGFGRQMSFQRLGSGGGGGPSRKRSRLMVPGAVQGIADQMTVLHRDSQSLVGRLDSMEQTLAALVGLDADAWPESMEDPSTASSGAAAVGDGGAGDAAGLKGEAAAAAASRMPPPSALEGAPLVKQQAVSRSAPISLPPPAESDTAGID